MEECPKGSYGQLCKENCSCDPCDKVTGCLNKTGKDNFYLPCIYMTTIFKIFLLIKLSHIKNVTFIVSPIHGQMFSSERL